MTDSVTALSSKQPVPHAGGTLTIKPGPNDSYQLGFRHTSSSHGMAFYQLAVSFDGRPLAFVPAGGVGSPMAPYPQPSVLAFIISDAQQMWGRVCPQCRTYFRTNHISGMTVCPYCTFAEDNIYFITDPQRRYLQKHVETVKRVLKEQKEIEIDLKEATDFPEWTYEERQLQHRFKCTTCDVTTDILGEYGSCPKCGKRNSGAVFHQNLKQIELDLMTATQDRRSDLLNRTVSVFEAMANDLKKILVSIPCHARRREQIRSLSFQDIDLAVGHLEHWYSFDLRKGLNAEDLPFADLMFKRRHLFTHNAGRVDEKYLRETGDKAYELNESIVLTAEDMVRLLEIIRKFGSNLIAEVDGLE